MNIIILNLRFLEAWYKQEFIFIGSEEMLITGKLQNQFTTPGIHLEAEWGMYALTHFPLDNMAAILADDIFRCISLNENDRIPIQISLKFVPRSLIDNKPALVQVMAWRRAGDKPLPEPMLAQSPDAYMWH